MKTAGTSGLRGARISARRWSDDPVWLDLIYAMILSERPTFDRRLWVYKDELASLGRLYSFEAAVSKGRKHGLCVVGGVQDWYSWTSNWANCPRRQCVCGFRSLLAMGGAECPDDQTYVQR